MSAGWGQADSKLLESMSTHPCLRVFSQYGGSKVARCLRCWLSVPMVCVWRRRASWALSCFFLAQSQKSQGHFDCIIFMIKESLSPTHFWGGRQFNSTMICEKYQRISRLPLKPHGSSLLQTVGAAFLMPIGSLSTWLLIFKEATLGLFTQHRVPGEKE